MEQIFANIVNEYYIRRIRELARRRREAFDRINTPEAAGKYVAHVRSVIRSAFALNREERTELSPEITGTFDLGRYKMENIIFESRPGYFVTGNLFLPKSDQQKNFPVLLELCGHNPDGKANRRGTQLAAALAANGMAVFAIDPVCQGERLQFPEANPSCEIVRGHNMLGKTMLAYGDFLCSWRAWDAVRAIDYLETRREINQDKIYAGGCSGGGTMTVFLAALDDRIKGSAPSCYVTSFERNIENELPVDSEQIPPGLAAKGIEIADFLIAAIPNPVCILGEDNDIFDPRGTREAFADVSKISSLLAVKTPPGLFIGPHSHGLWEDHREKMYEFFLRIAGLPRLRFPEKDVPAPLPEQQNAAPSGSVRNLPGNRTAREICRQRGRRIISARPSLTAAEIRRKIAEILHISMPAAQPDFRVLRASVFRGQCFSRFLLEVPETPIGVLKCLAEKELFHIVRAPRALLYLPHFESQRELLKIAPDEIEYGTRFAFDPFGIGEMTPSACDRSGRNIGASYNHDYHFAACGLLMDDPYQGLRVRGTLAAIRLLREAAGTEKLTLVGAGQTTVTALLAAFLDNTVSLELINPPESYESMLGALTPWPQTEIIQGILQWTDLPELYRMTRAKIISRTYAMFER